MHHNNINIWSSAQWSWQSQKVSRRSNVKAPPWWGLRSSRGRGTAAANLGWVEPQSRGEKEGGRECENSQSAGSASTRPHWQCPGPRMTDGSWSFIKTSNRAVRLEWESEQQCDSVKISPRAMCRKLEDCLLTRTGFRVFVVTAVMVVLAVFGLYRWGLRCEVWGGATLSIKYARVSRWSRHTNPKLSSDTIIFILSLQYKSCLSWSHLSGNTIIDKVGTSRQSKTTGRS